MTSSDKTYIENQINELVKQQEVLQLERACQVSALQLAQNQCSLTARKLTHLQEEIEAHKKSLIKLEKTSTQQQVDTQPMQTYSSMLNIEPKEVENIEPVSQFSSDNTQTINLDFTNPQIDKISDETMHF